MYSLQSNNTPGVRGTPTNDNGEPKTQADTDADTDKWEA